MVIEFQISPPLQVNTLPFLTTEMKLKCVLSLPLKGARGERVHPWGIVCYHNSVAIPRENLRMHTACLMRVSLITHVQKFLHHMHGACAKVFHATATLLHSIQCLTLPYSPPKRSRQYVHRVYHSPCLRHLGAAEREREKKKNFILASG